MDFNLTDPQQELQDLARRLATEATSVDAIEAAEQTPDRLDTGLWSALCEAGFAGIAIDEASGGLGMGALDIELVCESLGRAVSPTPIETHVVASAALSRFGGDDLAEIVEASASGECVVTMGLESWGSNDPLRPPLVGRRDGDVWHLNGEIPLVPWLHIADHVVVGFTHDTGIGIAVVEANTAGMSLSTAPVTNRELQSNTVFESCRVPSARVLGAGDEALRWLVASCRVASAGFVVGACERAIEITVEHANERVQFGRPLGANQAYSQRLASAAIDLDCIRLCARQGAWAIDAGGPFHDESLVAAWWASDAGSRIVHSTQHLHGGVGADQSYPVHRHYLAVKQRANYLGSASSHLAELGRNLATTAGTGVPTSGVISMRAGSASIPLI